jgi:hypothetical protein
VNMPPVRDMPVAVTTALREVKWLLFSEERPRQWSTSAEMLLNINVVNDCVLWFYYVQWALSAQQTKLVDNILALEPTPLDAYEILRYRLPGLHDRGEQDRFRQFN